VSDARAGFLDAARGATALLADPAVAARWDQPSVLPAFSVAGLAGHLLRGMTAVERYMDGPEPEGSPLRAPQYFHVVGVSPDVDAPGNVAVRARGEETAAEGPGAVAARAAATLPRLSERLGRTDLGRRISVIGGVVISVGEYLRTRVVELAVHGDDLALSVGAPTPAFADDTLQIAVDVLVAVAGVRHGRLAVLRALARRERDTAEALRVL